MIDLGDDADNEEDKLLMDIVQGNSDNEILEKFILGLNKILAQKRVGTIWAVAFKNIGGEESFAVARATFAAIVKLSGITEKLLNSLTMLELSEPSSFDDPDA